MHIVCALSIRNHAVLKVFTLGCVIRIGRILKTRRLKSRLPWTPTPRPDGQCACLSTCKPPTLGTRDVRSRPNILQALLEGFVRAPLVGGGATEDFFSMTELTLGTTTVVRIAFAEVSFGRNFSTAMTVQLLGLLLTLTHQCSFSRISSQMCGFLGWLSALTPHPL
jgi:hypothetical protein